MLHGLDHDWHATDLGDYRIYKQRPDDIPVACAARVIYELRLDIDRLNGEVMAARA